MKPLKEVDELQDFMTELKNNEKEKVNYMTYQMKIAEERSEAKAEERKIGIKNLIASAKILAASPAQAAEQLVKFYDLTEAEAKAAVQANW